MSAALETTQESENRKAFWGWERHASSVLRMSVIRSALVSFLFHALILAVMACIVQQTIIEGRFLLTSELVPDTPAPESFKFDVMISDKIGNDGDANLLSPSLAASTTPVNDAQRQIKQQVTEDAVDVNVPPPEELLSPQDTDLLARVETTGTTEHAGGVEGAIDRITFEIASSLRERPTLVIWLFDASLSLRSRRNAIADRFENIYRELREMKLGGEDDLLTAAVSFGETTNFLTPKPVADVSQVAGPVRNMANDESGKEMVFSAVRQALARWKSLRTKEKRNVLMVIVTDERGDDYDQLENVIKDLKVRGIRVLCVGNASLFGREKGYVTYTDERGYTWHNRPVDQGPETVAPELLQLAFWGRGGGRLERMSAGYGPYALTRLCTETGGLYLVADENDGPRFDPTVMRAYAPDYRPIAQYKKELDSNAAKHALVDAAVSTNIQEIPFPTLSFRADNEATLRQELNEAQKPFALLDYYLREMEKRLSDAEKYRRSLDSPRWRAGFDLALGRVLAMRVRAHGYNVVLADMKRQPKPFQREGSNVWRLVPSEGIDSTPQVTRMAKAAVAYLKGVIEQHPGTPWELLAREELKTPLGWAWQEDQVFYPPPPTPEQQAAAAQENMRRRQEAEARGPEPNL